ncbi:MAG: hypothetical protein H8E55_04155 [Pelagibacterales bacterium]|nr:hypothetical protein [Pelagibacterales bacterium]
MNFLKKLKIFSNNSTQNQKTFLDALEGIGDICVYQTKQRIKNKNIEEGLEKIRELVNQFFVIQREDPEKFKKLIFTPELNEIYKQNTKEAETRLHYYPEKNAISFSNAIGQILRIHEAAIDSKNDEISRIASYQICHLISDLTKFPGNDFFVEQLLRSLADLALVAIENRDVSMYSSSIHWYVDTIFRGGEDYDGSSFDLSYLEKFDKHFFISVQRIISNENTSLFNALLGMLVDRVQSVSYREGKIWDFRDYFVEDIQNEFFENIDELHKSSKEIFLKKDLDNWLVNFKNFTSSLGELVDDKNKQEFLELKKDVTSYVIYLYKYRNLLNMVFAICAFCLFKRKPEKIKLIWEYKQPPDSDAHWVGDDIVPGSIEEVLQIYIKSGFRNHFHLWEGHHGAEIYFEKYFILLLARVLLPVTVDQDRPGFYPGIENFELPIHDLHDLSNLEHSLDRLTKYTAELEKDIETIAGVGLSIEVKEELFQVKLIKLYEQIRLKIKNRFDDLLFYQSISKEKLEEFDEDFLNGYDHSSILRSIYDYYDSQFGLLDEEDPNKASVEKTNWGIKTTYDKGAFFDKWHVHYGKIGMSFGEDFGSAENIWILNNIFENCTETKTNFKLFQETYENFSSPIILYINLPGYSASNHILQFKSKKDLETPNIDVRGLIGWSKIQNKYIPVFGLRHEDRKRRAIVLNASNMGKVEQFSPLELGDDSQFEKDDFFIQIRAYSEHQNLMEETLNSPPGWLKEIGDLDTQKNYLRGKVLIDIRKKIIFNKGKEFQGYMFNL